jgi:hypothetical protein
MMTLLANVLSVSLSGLFTESSVLILQYAEFTASHQFILCCVIQSHGRYAATTLDGRTILLSAIRGICIIVCQRDTTHSRNARSQSVIALFPEATGDGWR